MPDRSLVPVEERTTVVAEPAGATLAERARIGFGAFAWLAVQVGLVLGVAVMYRIELERGFATIAALLFGGFLVHPWLPLRWRSPFFVLLTITALALLLGAGALWVVALGLGILALCHLPIAWEARVASILVVVGALAAVRSGTVRAPWGDEVLAVLAAMFMFRLVLYLYDLKNDQTPADPWQRVAYFFMLPNVFFPLFPVVDYKTFLRKYYDAPAAEIYQKGVYWMLRGVTHLLLYRLVYHLLPRADTDLHGILGVYVFMAMTYGLYLRVSGLFHLIVGSLCLFGFNLPTTNHHYFLASSFNDLWRRINIYWKDFMMTVVFYPVFMKVREWSMSSRLLVGTGGVFVITWFLHSYQWFWLEGVLPITLTDIVFWGALGLALAANSVWEARHGRRRRLGQPVWSCKAALGVTLRTIGVFSFIAIGWSLWNEGSFSGWWYRLLRVRESTMLDWTMFGALVGGVILSGIGAQWLAARGWGLGRMEQVAWRRAPMVVPAAALGLMFVVQPAVQSELPPELARAVGKARSTGLNWIDAERQERGYYETLSRSTRFGTAPQWAQPEPRDDELGINETPGATLETNDIRAFALVPNFEVVYKGATFRTNDLGLRDRPYQKAKPAGTYRIALLGASYVMGSGVENQETFENVLEDRLNRELAGRGYERYEILNFAVGGYGDLQMLYLAEQVVPDFRPDAVIFVIHPGVTFRIVDRLRFVLELGAPLGEDYAFVTQLLERSGARPGLPPDEFARRLRPYREELLHWTYRRGIEACRGYGAIPVFVFLPMTTRDFESSELASFTEFARASGAVAIPLRDVYEGYDVDRIRLTALDQHPNPLGHRLIAESLHAAMLERTDDLRLLDGRMSSVGATP